MIAFLATLFLGPRGVAVIWWLIQPGRWGDAFGHWVIPVLGILALPWTTLIYVIVYSLGDGVNGPIDWLFIALGLFADLASYGSSGYSARRSTEWMSDQAADQDDATM